jgi:hypothetical protein
MPKDQVSRIIRNIEKKMKEALEKHDQKVYDQKAETLQKIFQEAKSALERNHIHVFS